MKPLSRANWITLTGLAAAAAGVFLYSKLGEIDRGRVAVAVVSEASTFGGLLMALVGSVVWARRASLRQPLSLAVTIGIVVYAAGVCGYVNVHGSGALLLFVFLYAVFDVLLLIAVRYW